MIRVLLAVNDVRVADHLAALAAESDELEIVATLRDPQELRGTLPRTDADAVVLYDRRGPVPLVETSRELTVAHPDQGLVLVVAEDSPDLLRSGMQAGARDVIAEPVGLEQLESSAAAAAAWTRALRRRASREADETLGLGRVVTVVGAKGGVGTTTIAVHLALAARELGRASVCLVDFDLQTGDMRAFLDLPYRRSVVDLAAVANELTARHLHETLYNHGSGIRVLLSPQEGEQAEVVEAAAARNILTAIRTREDLTVIDAGSTLTEASAIAAEMADTVLIVTTPDVVSLRGVGRMCSLWERLRIEPAEAAVLLNRTSRKLEVQPDLARRVVPIPVLSTAVPADFYGLEPAVNTGLAASHPASGEMLKSMAALLGEIAALPQKGDGDPGSDRAQSIAARFAGESGQATIEFTGVLPLALVALIVVWQMVIVGLTFDFAGHAARMGARALAVGSPVVSAALGQVPSAWRGGADVITKPHDVEVQMQMPLLFPGVTVPVTIDSSAGTVIEDQPLAANQLAPGQTAPQGSSLGLSGVVTPTVPGTQAVLLPSGVAAAPADAPPQVKQAIAAANQLIDKPYIYGGGHTGSLAQVAPGYDCSSSTSFVLYLAGLHNAIPQVSGDFESWGAPGGGQWITVYANAGHMHVVIAGLNFDTAAGQGQPPNPPSTGPRWTQTLSDPGSYVVRHPAGL